MRTVMMYSRALAFALSLKHAACIDQHQSVECDASDTTCGAADESALLQSSMRKVAMDSKEVVGKQGGPEWFANAFGKAQDAVESVAVNALTTVADTLSGALSTVAADVDKFNASITSAEGSIESGVVSLLVEKLGVKTNKTKNLTSKEYEALATQVLSTGVQVWGTLVTSAQTGANALTKGMSAAGLTEAAKQLNTSLQSALDSSRKIQDSLRSLQEKLEKDSTASLLERAARTDLLEQVTQTVNEAKEDSATFSKSFSAVFKQVNDTMAASTKSLLSEDARSKVMKLFSDLPTLANKVGTKLSVASIALFTTVGDGVTELAPLIGGARGIVPNAFALMLALLAPAALRGVA